MPPTLSRAHRLPATNLAIGEGVPEAVYAYPSAVYPPANSIEIPTPHPPRCISRVARRVGRSPRRFFDGIAANFTDRPFEGGLPAPSRAAEPLDSPLRALLARVRTLDSPLRALLARVRTLDSPLHASL